MTLRSSGRNVKELIETSIEVDVIEANHLLTANNFVTDHLGTSTILSTAALADIEMYLAAHFVALTEEKGGITSESMGDAATKMFGKFEAGLGGTRYGQQAMSLDVTGTLRSLGSPALKARFTVV